MIFVPSRKFRREQAGKPCGLCGIRMHHLDVVAAADGDRVQFAHGSCLMQMAEMAQPPAEEETPGAAQESGATGLDAQISIVLDEEGTV